MLFRMRGVPSRLEFMKFFRKRRALSNVAISAPPVAKPISPIMILSVSYPTLRIAWYTASNCASKRFL